MTLCILLQHNNSQDEKYDKNNIRDKANLIHGLELNLWDAKFRLFASGEMHI